MLCKCCGEVEAVELQFTKNGVEIGKYCVECWKKIKLCEHCGEPHVFQQDARKPGVSYYGDTNEYLCTVCRKHSLTQEAETCIRCGSMSSKITDFGDNKKYCVSCASRYYFKCEICGKYHTTDKNMWVHDINRATYKELYYKTVGGICELCYKKAVAVLTPVETHKCSFCDNLAEYSYRDKVKGVTHKFCSKCAPHVKQCDDCGSVHPRSIVRMRLSDENGVEYNKFLCDTCMHTYASCLRCGLLTKKDHAEKTEGHDPFGAKSTFYKCQHCIKNECTCNRCGVDTTTDRCKKIGNDMYCKNCVPYVVKCPVCKNISHYNVNGYCRKCYAIKNGLGVVQKYNYTPKFNFHKSCQSSKLLFGIENELQIDGRVSNVEKEIGWLHKIWDEKDMYCVHDGSINYGFETVFHPRDFQSIKKVDWNNAIPPNVLKHSSCGMHVHMSREAFTPFHLFKFVKFVNDYPNFIRIVAQRMNVHHCEKNQESPKHLAKSGRSAHRYLNINMTNKHTIEIRFFSGAVSSIGILKNIEFLKALFDFTLASSPQQCTLDNFIKYVAVNSREFSSFVTFLKRYKLCV